MTDPAPPPPPVVKKAPPPAANTAPATPVYAPASLSVHVQCDQGHSVTGLFVILRMAVPGKPHETDAVVDIAHGTPAKGDAPPTNAPDPNLLVKFVCTIVDGKGFLQPVDERNPWHLLWNHEPVVTNAQKGAAVKNGDIVRVSVETDAQYVGCLLRHPQPSVARALTHWLNTGLDPENHGFASWPKARKESDRLTGETSLGGRELLARVLPLKIDGAKGAQPKLEVSEKSEDYLPPPSIARGGWLLYYDMPNADCPPIAPLVEKLQRQIGVLRFPIGGDDNPYAPHASKKDGNVGRFDARTLSAVKTFQDVAASGEVFRPETWPPDHESTADGMHDWWFAVGTVDTISPVKRFIPCCVDETMWAALDDWIKKKVCKRQWLLVKNPQNYMRVDAALAVLAWKKLAAVFGVDYPGDPDDRQLASGYSLAQYLSMAGPTDKPIAHPHKTGHALDFSVVSDAVAGNYYEGKEPKQWAISDWAHAQRSWPIHIEGQWFMLKDRDLVKPKQGTLDQAKAAQRRAETDHKNAVKAEADKQKALTDAEQAITDADALPTTDDDPKKAASLARTATAAKKRARDALPGVRKAHDDATKLRVKTEQDLAKANEGVENAEKDLQKARDEQATIKTDPSRGYWNHIFRIYGHSNLDFFGKADGAVDAAFDKLYASLNGMTAKLVSELLGPRTARTHEIPPPTTDLSKAFYTSHLAFLQAWETQLLADIGPPEARNQAGRLKWRDKLLREWLTPWNYNPYSHAGGSAGAKVYPSADTAPVDYENPETTATRQPPKDAKSFVNLSYLGWKCDMLRITNGPGRDPHWKNGKPPPRQKHMGPMPTIFSRLVGLIDRMGRSDSEEQDEDIVSGPVTHQLKDLDVPFMLRWVRSFAKMKPSADALKKHPTALVTIQAPQVTLQLAAVDAGMPQLEAVFAVLDENATNNFVLLSIGKAAIIAKELVDESGKPAIGADDVGKIDTGAAWRAKLANVAALFKDKVAPVNQTPDAKAAGPGAKKPPPTKSQPRDPADIRIVLQPVFEKVAPAKLADVAFQIAHICEMPTPGGGKALEWWHYQHRSSADVLYGTLLAEIGYWPDLLFERREAPDTDAADKYNGRSVGSSITVEMAKTKYTYTGAATEIENGQSEFRIGL